MWDQADGSELIFLALPVGLPYLTSPAVENESGQGVAGFSHWQLNMNLPAVALVTIDNVQQMLGFGYSAALRQRFSEQG